MTRKTARDHVKAWLPPALLDIARRALEPAAESVRLDGAFDTWEEAAARCRGYDDPVILDKVLAAALKVKRGEAAYERDSVVFDEVQYSWPLLAGLMWVAARHGGRLDVLDFGGALGSSYFQNRKFLRGLAQVRWGVVEQAHYVKAGRAQIQDDQLRFHATVEECLLAQAPNVILLSGVLPCIGDPQGLLASLLASGCDTVILDRTSYVRPGAKERIAIQHVPAAIYPASYPCRFFVEAEMLATFRAAGYALVEQFQTLGTPVPWATWKGHIFVRQSAERSSSVGRE